MWRGRGAFGILVRRDFKNQGIDTAVSKQAGVAGLLFEGANHFLQGRAEDTPEGRTFKRGEDGIRFQFYLEIKLSELQTIPP